MRLTYELQVAGCQVFSFFLNCLFLFYFVLLVKIAYIFLGYFFKPEHTIFFFWLDHPEGGHRF